MRRFLLYSHDGLGLGHVRRNLAIARALTDVSADACVLVLTSAAEAESLGVPPRVSVVKLPGPHRSDQRVLAAAVELFRPEVLLVDQNPFGPAGELGPALELVRASGGQAVLGLPDVLDDANGVELEWRGRGLFERIPQYFDRVLVYGQPDLFDPIHEYSFPDDVAALCSFCGYVVAPGARGRRAERPNGHGARRPSAEPVVLATAGGGEDGYALLETFLEATADAHWRAVVVSGAHCPPEQADRLGTLAAEVGVAFRRFVPGLSARFRSLDALVCMGGYNTLAEAAASGVATVCIPRVRPRREQLIRARVFERRGLLRMVEPRRLDPAVLKAEVESAIEANGAARRQAPALDVLGARRAARHLLEVAGGV
jgi:predicted glycosyltransferase